MPNWCENNLKVSSTEDNDELQSFYLNTKGPKDQPFTFDKLVPIPEDKRENGWYNWCITNWGTKWDACDIEELSITPKDGYLLWFFNTAWAPPIAWIEKVAKIYPTLSFRLKYEESGAGFFGLAKGENGIITDQCINE